MCAPLPELPASSICSARLVRSALAKLDISAVLRESGLAAPTKMATRRSAPAVELPAAEPVVSSVPSLLTCMKSHGLPVVMQPEKAKRRASMWLPGSLVTGAPSVPFHLRQKHAPRVAMASVAFGTETGEPATSTKQIGRAH